MFPHPDTVCVLKEMDHRNTLAKAARARRAAEARPAGGAHSIAAVRTRVGVALVALGTRLGGAYAVAPATGTAVVGAPQSAR